MVYVARTKWDRIKGSWLDHTCVRVSPEGESVGLGRLLAILQGLRCEYIASLHTRPSVHGEEPKPVGSDPVYQNTEEEQSPILRCEHCTYSMNGSG
jgi:hypothetical protein